MDTLYFQALIQGIVEGITEFLPISSTGHMILVDTIPSMRMDGDFAKVFEVVIQLGAILSVIVYFNKKLFRFTYQNDELAFAVPLGTWMKTIVAVVPALVIGGLLGSWIQEKLFSPAVVAAALILGGVVLIAVDRPSKGGDKKKKAEEVKDLTYGKAFSIGLIQCLAMIPGTSRSAATIIGGMCLGCSRSLAAEFSFFLAIPTMIAASGYTLMKHGANISGSEWVALGIGFVTAFVVALAFTALLMAYIKKHDFRIFGYYRIILGIVIITLLLAGTIATGGGEV